MAWELLRTLNPNIFLDLKINRRNSNRRTHTHMSAYVLTECVGVYSYEHVYTFCTAIGKGVHVVSPLSLPSANAHTSASTNSGETGRCTVLIDEVVDCYSRINVTASISSLHLPFVAFRLTWSPHLQNKNKKNVINQLNSHVFRPFQSALIRSKIESHIRPSLICFLYSPA